MEKIIRGIYKKGKSKKRLNVETSLENVGIYFGARHIGKFGENA